MFKEKRVKELEKIIEIHKDLLPLIKEELKYLEKIEDINISNEMYGFRRLFIEVYLFVHLIVQSFRFLE